MMTTVLENPTASLARRESAGEIPTQMLGNAAAIAAKLAGTPTRYVYPTCRDFPEPCQHAASYHVATKADLNESHRFFGLKRRSDGSAHWVETGAARRRDVLPVRVRESVAACAAVGLSYWSDAPVSGGMWAVDSAQQAHLVKVDRREHRIVVVCTPGHPLGAAAHTCQYGDRQETYEVPLTNEGLADLMGVGEFGLLGDGGLVVALGVVLGGGGEVVDSVIADQGCSDDACDEFRVRVR